MSPCLLRGGIETSTNPGDEHHVQPPRRAVHVPAGDGPQGGTAAPASHRAGRWGHPHLVAPPPGRTPSRRTPSGAACAMMTDVWMDRSRTEAIVGREPELEALVRSAISSGQSRMVLLSGDAGVGKTRLLSDALERLGDQGWRV